MRRCNFNYIIFRIPTFTIYIRILIQAFMYLSLCSISELYNLKTSSASKIVSYSISIIIWIILACFLVLAIWCLVMYKNSVRTDFKCSELFNDMKPRSLPRLFNLIMIFKKLIYTIWLIWFSTEFVSIEVSLIILIGIQFLSLIYYIFVRPYYKTSNNIIVIVNELTFTLWLSALTHYNQK